MPQFFETLFGKLMNQLYARLLLGRFRYRQFTRTGTNLGPFGSDQSLRNMGMAAITEREILTLLADAKKLFPILFRDNYFRGKIGSDMRTSQDG